MEELRRKFSAKTVRAGMPENEFFHRKDGSRVPLEYVKTPIHENEREVGAVLVFKDIAERKRVEEAIAQKAAELARSNAELEQFAFVASHDLQEPLRKIQAFGDRLKGKIGGEIAPEAQEYLERMQNASARMRTLINDLLTFSRVIRRTEPFRLGGSRGRNERRAGRFGSPHRKIRGQKSK